VQPEPFNPELTRILDRVYGVHLVDGIDRAASPIKADLSRLRRQRGVEALERALDDLRQVRDRSQGMAAIKDELDFLHTQIVELKALGEEINRLRMQLAKPPATQVSAEGGATPQGFRGA
jgi:DNA-binding FrmR family transcriptional regulator